MRTTIRLLYYHIRAFTRPSAPIIMRQFRTTRSFLGIKMYRGDSPMDVRSYGSSKCGDDSSWSKKLQSDCPQQPSYIKQTNTAALKRGTGGRSSFSGIVATVFGSSGFLGRYVVNRLGKIGTQLILPYRGDFDEMRRLKVSGDLGQVLFQPYNLKDEGSICKAVKYSNTVINLVGRDWETKNYKFTDVHVEGARSLARISKAAGVKKFIHVSALNASEKPEVYMKKGGSKWLASKWEGEEAVRQEFPEAIIFRPSNMVGAEDRFACYFASRIRHHSWYLGLYKKGTATEKQPVYVGDVAQGIVEACRCAHLQGETIQAVGPRRYHLSELVDWFHRVLRREKQYGWPYKRYDLRWDPFMRLRISLLPLLTTGHPWNNLTWETVERECHSDDIDCSMMTLLDLGVDLTLMEQIVPWVLRPLRHWGYYNMEMGEFAEPTPPEYIAALGDSAENDNCDGEEAQC